MKCFVKMPALAFVFSLCAGFAIVQAAAGELESASAAFAAGEFQKSAAMYGEELAKQPDSIPALLGAGRVALLSNKLEESERYLRKGLTLDRENKELRSNLAEALYRQDRFTEAASFLEESESGSMIRKLNSFADQAPYLLESPADTTTVKLANLDPLPAIEVRVNGKEPVYFLLDTGGSEIILDQEYAKEVEAQTFGEQSSTFAGGSKASYQHGRIESLGIGEFQVRNIPVHIMGTRAFSAAAAGKRIDGIIGTIFLYHFCATLDYRAQQFTLRKKELCDAKASIARNTISVPFWMAGDHILVARGVVNGTVPTLLFVDTGLAGYAFTGPESIIKEAGVEIPKGEEQEGIGGGGKVKIVPFTLKELSLGQIRQTDVPSLMGPFPAILENKYGFRIGGLVSHVFFRSYAVTFDFQNMMLHLQP